MPHDPRPSHFRRFAWLVLAYTFAVIVFGAWVRITGSGAGCGQHWPTCHGEVLHRPETVETVIELTHRVTSGLSLVAVLVLLVIGLRRYDRGHPVRWGVALATVFMILEALIGAGLVLLELVGRNDSASRAVVMAIHLSNTCLLTGAMTVAAWFGGESNRGTRPRLGLRGAGPKFWYLLAGLGGVIVVAMSGAVTALGDTLYPVLSEGGVAEHLQADQGLTSHFLQRMRIVHPLLAMGVGLYLLWLTITQPEFPERLWVGRSAKLVAVLVLIQLCAGVVNIVLSAPGWMQLVHLSTGTALWIALVTLALAVLEPDPSRGSDPL